MSDAANARDTLGVRVCGPTKAIRLLSVDTAQTDEWLRTARTVAIAGSCPRSHAEIRSAVRAYALFASKMQRVALPPSLDMLLAWSCFFRCSGTFKNYVSSLRTACQLAGISTDETHGLVLRKAINAIDKRRGYIARKPLFIRADLIRRILQSTGPQPTARAKCFAMALLTTYVFLLRMPSECLPIRVAGPRSECGAHQAVLRRRKNKDAGSVLQRRCWCRKCCATCPVHILGPFFPSLRP